MTGRSYVIEEECEGKSLVVTGPWSQELSRVLSSGQIQGLVLNYARGFCEGSLDQIRDWPLRRLSVLDRSINDLSPIARLARLEELSIQAGPEAVLEPDALPGLRAIDGEWGLIGRTLSAATHLERVSTWLFGEPDLHAFRDQFALKSLVIKDAPRLESLAGLGGLSDLENLAIVGARRLHDIGEIAALSESLRELTFESCPGIETLEVVKSLTELRFLGISESGDIASLAPVASLSQLEMFHAWGSTRIVDGDLSPLSRLPRLSEIRMRNRRGYVPPVADLPASVW